jgi:Fe2+ or Zn2+ uptake regulation protein
MEAIIYCVEDFIGKCRRFAAISGGGGTGPHVPFSGSERNSILFASAQRLDRALSWQPNEKAPGMWESNFAGWGSDVHTGLFRIRIKFVLLTHGWGWRPDSRDNRLQYHPDPKGSETTYHDDGSFIIILHDIEQVVPISNEDLETLRIAFELLPKLSELQHHVDLQGEIPVDRAAEQFESMASNPCVRDILLVLKETGHRLTQAGVYNALDILHKSNIIKVMHGRSTVNGYLAVLVKSGKLTQEQRCEPSGYGLPEWGNGPGPSADGR